MKAYELLVAEMFPMGITRDMRTKVVKDITKKKPEEIPIFDVPEQFVDIYVAGRVLAMNIIEERNKMMSKMLDAAKSTLSTETTSKNLLYQMMDAIKDINPPARTVILGEYAQLLRNFFWVEINKIWCEKNPEESLILLGVRLTEDKLVIVEHRNENPLAALLGGSEEEE